jgi:hypothetical protein
MFFLRGMLLMGSCTKWEVESYFFNINYYQAEQKSVMSVKPCQLVQVELR